MNPSGNILLAGGAGFLAHSILGKRVRNPYNGFIGTIEFVHLQTKEVPYCRLDVKPEGCSHIETVLFEEVEFLE